jgi:hypothetical protein
VSSSAGSQAVNKFRMGEHFAFNDTRRGSLSRRGVVLHMAPIELPVVPELGREFSGIVGPMTFRPETAAPMNKLVNILLRDESKFDSRGARPDCDS